MLGHLVRTDFEGDQFTFFKPPQGDLERLYGVDIHEMQPVGALPDQMAEQLAHGRSMTAELDSFFLPDTAATDYRRDHVKTTIAVDAIDRDGEWLALLPQPGPPRAVGRGLPRRLPPRRRATETAAAVPRAGPLRRAAPPPTRGASPASCSPTTCATARRTTPSRASARGWQSDLPRLLEGSSEDFHAYAFATVRMAGAAFELLQSARRMAARGSRVRAAGPHRRGLQGPVVPPRPAARVRPRPRDRRHGRGLGGGHGRPGGRGSPMTGGGDRRTEALRAVPA